MSMKSILSVFVLLSTFFSGLLQADPVADNSKILVIGPAADTHAEALQGMIDGHPATVGRGMTVDAFSIASSPAEEASLLSQVGKNWGKWILGGGYTPAYTPNPLLNTLDEDYDILLIHADRDLLRSPETVMVALRWLQTYVRPMGPRILLILPPYSSEQVLFENKSYAYPADNATMAKEQLYRIGDALDLEVVPAGMVWQALEQDPAYTLPGFAAYTGLSWGSSNDSDYFPEHYQPDTYQTAVYATTIFSALFETTPAAAAYRPGGVGDVEFADISAKAFQVWDQARTADHYTGPFLGNTGPVISSDAYPDLLYDLSGMFKATGASTEGFTAIELRNIYSRKGLSATSSNDTGIHYEFEYGRSSYPSMEHDVYLYLKYKAAPLADFIDGSVKNFAGRQPNRKYVYNAMSQAMLLVEDPSFRIGNYGDGHNNQDFSMLQAAQINTIVTGGEHPFLEGDVDLSLWDGPQRFAATIGYWTAMSPGRLARIEHPPVSIGFPRFYVDRESANPVSLLGYDLDGIPVTVEILTPPAHGTLVQQGPVGEPYSGVSGTEFIYTPGPGFDGLDEVTYRVVNSNGVSQPLTIQLYVGPYQPAPVSGDVVFSENFDDEDASEWVTSEPPRFTSSRPVSIQRGYPIPRDGASGFYLPSYQWALVPVETSWFENLQLTVRAGLDFNGVHDTLGDTQEASVYVEWYDGSEWHTAVDHRRDNKYHYLLQTYQVSLPPGAADNPDFQLRLRAGSGVAGIFDSIVLSGDPIPAPPVVQDQHITVAKNLPADLTLDVMEPNRYDTLVYTLGAPSHGTLSGTPPAITYTPAVDYTGNDAFTFTVSDGTFSVGGTVMVTVRENSAPVVTAGDDRVVNLTVLPFWTPADTTTVGWYDASDTESIVLADGKVSQWRDKSGHGHHLSQSEASKRPVVSAGLSNALPGVTFGGPEHGMTTLNNPFGLEVSEAQIYMIYRENKRGGNPGGELINLTGTSDGWKANAPNYLGTSTFSTPGGNTSTKLGVSLGTPFLFSCYGSVTDNQRVIFRNGSLAVEGTGVSSGETSGGLILGNNGRNPHQNGTIGECIVLNESMSLETRQNLEGYLAHKWGLVAELPMDHPYKASPPGGPYATFDLLGAVSDGEDDSLITEWTQISGPGEAMFTSTTDATTTVTVLEPGTYVFRLTSDDGLAVTTDEVTITIPAPMVDADNDGLDDAWETEHFPGQEASIDGTLDSDGDGVKDFIEFLTGTDPNISNEDMLALGAGRSAHGSGSVFKWTVKEGFAAGQHYQVLYSTDLSGWNPLPPEHYSVTPNVVDGMNHLEMEVTHDYGDHIFITLDKP